MSEDRKVLSLSPENSETPLQELHGWVTPIRLFFVRNHFDVPEIDRDSWSLRVEGCVRRPLTLNWEQLQAYPQRSVFSTVECAGNGRSFLKKHVEGVQWGAGAVGHAEWSGVPLRFVLEEAGLTPETCEIVLEGADIGTEKGHSGPMSFARSLPIDKALHADTLLATRMNGEPLEPSHGFPVRLLVPGWYGVASVKWLTRIEAVSEPFQGYFQTVKYTVKRRTGRGEMTEVVGAMPPKSEILKPSDGAELGVGTNRIFGFAWAGEDAIARVEVSVDGGESWSSAELNGPRAPYSWTLWEYLWESSGPGEYRLLSRAVSQRGQVQPMDHDPLWGGYQINFSRPAIVTVKAGLRGRDLPGDRGSLRRELEAAVEERSRLPLDVEVQYAEGAGI
jgi:DMSO/TMAO reductase YedYZ molybdopterin-dependent catalytic subunit